LTKDEIQNLGKTADDTGKADSIKDFELKDTNGNVCCLAWGSFQVSRA
jgi:hypothetical protein